MLTAPLDPAERLRAIRGLGMGGAVLHLGAHPDDEDGDLIAYLSRGRAVRTVYWSATRGEGGQNHVGDERGEALGVLRTWEALAARRIDGGELLYGPFYDFGYSRSGTHALQRWKREAVVCEVVRAIRVVQPQIVVSRWAGTSDDGHGQHEAIGLVAGEAFERAADPDSFRELDLPPWQASKLYHSLEGDWQPGEEISTEPVDAPGSLEDVRSGSLPNGRVRLDFGAYDPGTGRTFHELSCLARNQHRSQAMAALPERGPFYRSYQLALSRLPVTRPQADLFDGLDPSLVGVADHGDPSTAALRAGLRRVCGFVADAVSTYTPDDPAGVVDALLAGRRALEEALEAVASSITDRHDASALERYLRRRLVAFDTVIASCLGLSLEAVLDRPRATAGDVVRVRTRIWNFGNADVRAGRILIETPDGWTTASLAGTGGTDPAEGIAGTEHEIRIPGAPDLSCPYWLRHPREPFRYVLPEAGPVGAAFDESPVSAVCAVRVRDHTISLRAPALHHEAAAGTLPQRTLAVLPPVGLRPRRRTRLVPAGPGALAVPVDVEVRRLRDSPTAGRLTIEVPVGWETSPAAVDLDLAEATESNTASFSLQVPADTQNGLYHAAVVFTMDDGTRCESVVDIATAPHEALSGGVRPAEVALVTPAVLALHLVPVHFVDGLRYAVVQGPEDETAAVLEGFGVGVEELSDEDLVYADLSVFDTVMIGANAYSARTAVRRSARRLLEYVHRGGTLVVQQQGYAYQHLQATPYPLAFNQPHDRVTMAEAPVTALDPDHLLLHLPNRIGPSDWEGWVQDRGKYFAGSWDPRYVPILAANDPGEPPQAGGLLVAGYGYGTYAYVAYSLHRQIAAGVPGAVRLLANLLGLAEARIRERMHAARSTSLLASMSEAQLHDIARIVTERWYADGSTLCREGEPGDELFMVHEGEVEIRRNGRVVHVARPGEAVGELAVLADVPRSATLRARGDVKVLMMLGPDFRRLLDDHPDISQELLRTLATRLAGAAGGG